MKESVAWAECVGSVCFFLNKNTLLEPEVPLPLSAVRKKNSAEKADRQLGKWLKI